MLVPEVGYVFHTRFLIEHANECASMAAAMAAKGEHNLASEYWKKAVSICRNRKSIVVFSTTLLGMIRQGESKWAKDFYFSEVGNLWQQRMCFLI